MSSTISPSFGSFGGPLDTSIENALWDIVEIIQRRACDEMSVAGF